MKKQRGITVLAAGVAGLFGLASIVAGGNALFGSDEARAAVGNAVPIVLWFNFLAGFVYVVCAVSLFRERAWAHGLATLILVSTLVIFAIFGLHVAQGGAYEMRTLGAMTLRTLVWAAIAHYAFWALRKPNST